MLLRLLPLDRWLQFEKRRDCCLGSLVPNKKDVNNIAEVMKSAERRVLTRFSRASSMLGPVRRRGCVEALGRMISNWLDSTWSAN